MIDSSIYNSNSILCQNKKSRLYIKFEREEYFIY